MVQPTTLVLALALLLATTARAQLSPSREQQQRSITLTGNPSEPPHEIHVAKGVATLILFDDAISREAVEVDKTRVKLLDAGERSIIFEPVIELGREERLVLSVPFADGQRAVFVLVSHVSEVDTRIDVVRREQTVKACQAELAEAQARCAKISPARFGQAGWLTKKGVIPHRIHPCQGELVMDGLVCTEGTAYSAEKWALVDVEIRNESNDQPWIPSEVTLKGMKSGVHVTVRAVEMDAAQLGPGEARHVFVEVDPPANGAPFVLELRDAAGRGMTVPLGSLSAQESKQ